MAVNRRTLWLGGALAIALVALVVAQSGSDGPAVATGSRRAAATPAPPAAQEAPVAIELSALARERNAPTDTERNPFRFGAAASSVPGPSIANGPRPGAPAGEAGPPIPRAAVPSGPPPPPPITLKFIGVVEKADGTRIAVLSDGTRPMSAREGEEIEGRYRILKIDAESLEIAYLDGRGRQTLRLTGQ